ncbi:MAG: hypothetical protein HY400_03865 [Elusimicrobia bacterium]|nr:hypothetical protein [Elusimicrobiota bacterium]
MDALIDRDIKEGDGRKVDATPTFFINGKRFVGPGQLAQQGVIWVETRVGR